MTHCLLYLHANNHIRGQGIIYFSLNCYSYVIFAIHLENILFLNVLLPGCNQNAL